MRAMSRDGGSKSPDPLLHGCDASLVIFYLVTQTSVVHYGVPDFPHGVRDSDELRCEPHLRLGLPVLEALETGVRLVETAIRSSHFVANALENLNRQVSWLHRPPSITMPASAAMSRPAPWRTSVQPLSPDYFCFFASSSLYFLMSSSPSAVGSGAYRENSIVNSAFP